MYWNIRLQSRIRNSASRRSLSRAFLFRLLSGRKRLRVVPVDPPVHVARLLVFLSFVHYLTNTSTSTTFVSTICTNTICISIYHVLPIIDHVPITTSFFPSISYYFIILSRRSHSLSNSASLLLKCSISACNWFALSLPCHTVFVKPFHFDGRSR